MSNDDESRGEPDGVVDAEIIDADDETGDSGPSWGFDRLVWIDIETTGLDFKRMGMLEIGVMVTGRGPSFTEYASKSWLVYPRRANRVAPIRSECWDQHIKSGLWAQAIEEGLPYQVVLCQLEGWLAREDADGGLIDGNLFGGPMCGSSPHFDRRVLEQFAGSPCREDADSGFFAGWSHMTGLVDRIWSYRNFDVSTLREAASQLHGPRAVDAVVGTDEPPHLALFDLARSVEMARKLLTYPAFI